MKSKSIGIDIADMSAGGPVEVASPTAITHSIPRPKSPRRPEYRKPAGNPAGSSSNGFLAAESFSKAYGGARDPKVRRRHFSEMGHFDISKIKIKSSRSIEEFEPRLCGPVDVSGFVRFNKESRSCMSGTVETSKEYAVMYGAPAKDNLLNCVSSSTAYAGEGISEFTMTATEAYRQECKTDNRGDDTAFFMESENSGAENNSVVDISSSDAERRDSLGEPSPSRPRSKSEPPPFRSPRSLRFPESLDVMKDPAADTEMSPPRVERLDTSRWNLGANPHDTAVEENSDDLREARLELFRKGSDMEETEVRLARALEDLNRQDSTIEELQKQLRDTRKHLEEASKELEDSRAMSQQRQYNVTEIRAPAALAVCTFNLLCS